jgi:hypothetical protein
VSGASGQPDSIPSPSASADPATRSGEMIRGASAGYDSERPSGPGDGSSTGSNYISSDITPESATGGMGVEVGAGFPPPASTPPNTRADQIWGAGNWEICTRAECCADTTQRYVIHSRVFHG